MVKVLKINQKGQVTIFVIVGILIVVGVVITTMIISKGKKVDTPFTPGENPKYFISKCAEYALQEAIFEIMPKGGYIEPQFFKEYQNQKIPYICYTSEYNTQCVNQEPLYSKHLVGEFEDYIFPKLVDCFEQVEQEYQDRGIFTQLEDNTEMKISIDILPGKIHTLIEREFLIEENGETISYSEFRASLESNLFDVVKTIERAVSHESKFCSFDVSDYSTFYPELKITKKGLNDGTIIYNIKDELTLIETNFAVRGCVHHL